MIDHAGADISAYQHTCHQHLLSAPATQLECRQAACSIARPTAPPTDMAMVWGCLFWKMSQE
jgi:hypothetical protein